MRTYSILALFLVLYIPSLHCSDVNPSGSATSDNSSATHNPVSPSQTQINTHLDPDVATTIHVISLVGATASAHATNSLTKSAVRSVRDEISPDTDENLNTYLEQEWIENSITMLSALCGTVVADLIFDGLLDVMGESSSFHQHVTEGCKAVFHLSRGINALANIGHRMNHNFHPDIAPYDEAYHQKARQHRDRNNMLATNGGILLAQIAESVITRQIQEIDNHTA